MGGVTLASSISGSLDAKNIVLGVLEKSLTLGGIANMIQRVEVPELTANIPVGTIPTGMADLQEWEHSEVYGSDFSYVAFSLLKDRIKLGVSDEAQYKSKVGDPLAIQKNSAASRLAYMLETKVITALKTNPQTGAAAAVWNSGHPIADLATAVNAIRPFKADFVIMPSAVWAIYAANADISGAGVPYMSDKPGALTRVPGLGMDIFVCDNGLTAKTCIVGSSQAPCAVQGVGPVKVRQFDSESGGTVYQMDVFRQVVAPILKNPTNNMGCYILTSVIS